MFNNLSEVTYESFGINTKDFYNNKFNAVPHHDYFDMPANKYLLGSSRIRYICSNLNGGKVLDLGCGGGPYGMTLKKNGFVDYLVGIDLDPDCIRTAGECYDEVYVLNMYTSLPFPDNTFDAVISSDFFGHVEFRYKDAIIAEIHRVLKPDGRTIHTIESGFIDYLNCNQNDPQDAVRKYVYVDGHIGIEPEKNIKDRFSAVFNNVSIKNGMLFPFFTVQGFINNPDVFGSEFADLLKTFSPAETQAADVVSGYICEYIENELIKENPKNLDPTANTNIPNVFRRTCGIMFLTAYK